MGDGLAPGLRGRNGGLKDPMLAAMNAPENGDPAWLLGVGGPIWSMPAEEVMGGVGPPPDEAEVALGC